MVNQVKSRVTAALAAGSTIDTPLDAASGAFPVITAGAPSPLSYDQLTSLTAAGTVVKSQAIPGGATASLDFVHVELVAAAAAGRYIQVFIGGAPAAGDRPWFRSPTIVAPGGQFEMAFPTRVQLLLGATIIESTTQDTWTDPGGVTELRAFSTGTV